MGVPKGAKNKGLIARRGRIGTTEERVRVYDFLQKLSYRRCATHPKSSEIHLLVIDEEHKTVEEGDESIGSPDSLF